jgi:hypothetical protein
MTSCAAWLDRAEATAIACGDDPPAEVRLLRKYGGRCRNFVR